MLEVWAGVPKESRGNDGQLRMEYNGLCVQGSQQNPLLCMKEKDRGFMHGLLWQP